MQTLGTLTVTTVYTGCLQYILIPRYMHPYPDILVIICDYMNSVAVLTTLFLIKSEITPVISTISMYRRRKAVKLMLFKCTIP